MRNYIAKLFEKKPVQNPIIEPTQNSTGFFSTDFKFNYKSASEAMKDAEKKTFQRDVTDDLAIEHGATMDSASQNYLKTNFAINQPASCAQITWYGSQSFIGYQICVIMSQNWLIEKCCSMPAKDATRKGYEVTVNDGDELPDKTAIFDDIRKADKEYKLCENMVEFVTKGRMYGIRICLFLIDMPDSEKTEFYLNPFNIDAVKPGSYRGMTQIDPFWVTPELDADASGNPASQFFYEPTWWRINGRRYHRTHLVIFRTGELPDTLKPTYVYGSISIPQKIYERVYAAERTANEAPLLALTKRTMVWKMDVAQALAQGQAFFDKLQQQVYLKDNYGQQTIGLDDEVSQFDTSLNDFDALIMTQYQLVAASANVPSTKLLGTSPKGFNTTGEFEEANYHEELESIQSHNLTPLAERHHQLVIKSDISPKYGIDPFESTITWKPLDSLTAKEEAENNNIRADTDLKLTQAGAIDGNDIRDRIINDPNSGYSGIENGAPELTEQESEGELGEESNDET